MSDFMRGIPITPDMVSLWVPSGLNRAQDLIRGNHGQCYGTHPNVPVISKPTKEVLTDGGLNIWTSATDLTHWTEALTGSSTVNREAAEKVEGSYSCRLGVDADNASLSVQEAITLVPGKRHRIVLWYKNSIAGKNSRIQFFDEANNVFLDTNGDWQVVSSSIVIANSTIWKRHGLDFTAHADYSSYIIKLRSLTSASSSIYFDDVSVKEFKPVLINPSVGWSFDGTNYIDLGKDIDIGKVHTVASWFNIDSLVTNQFVSLIGNDDSFATPLMVRTDMPLLYYHEGTGYVSVVWSGYETGAWHHFTTVRSGTSVSFYIDAVKIGTTQTIINNDDIDIHTIGDRNSDTKWYGLIALPFMANKAWSAAQVSNFYNATKGFFAPRG